MEKKFKYTFDYLQELESQNSAVLLEDYAKIHITGQLHITYKCKCNVIVTNRRLDYIKKYGGMVCDKCNRANKNKKLLDYSKRCKYDLELLTSLIKKDNAILNTIPDKLNFRTEINFTCKCGETTKKLFGHINKFNGAFCKRCGTVKESYNEDLLLKLSQQYNATSLSYEKNLSCKSFITFHCSCGKEETKQFSILNTSSGGMQCYSCAKIKGRDKFKVTNEKIFGGHPMTSNIIKNKIRNTCIKKYGVNNTFSNEEIKRQICETNIKKYGVKYPSQSIAIQEKLQKSLLKFKNYIMPNGDIRRIQGYENMALDELIKEFSPDDIVTSRKYIPRIRYTKNNKELYYFPDIFIPKINKIIEVKSDYTYTFAHSNIIEKQEATKNAGYNYEIWIYKRNGEKTIIQ